MGLCSELIEKVSSISQGRKQDFKFTLLMNNNYLLALVARVFVCSIKRYVM